MISLQLIIPLGCLVALSSALPWNDQLDGLYALGDGSNDGDCQSIGARGRGSGRAYTHLGEDLGDIFASCSGILDTAPQTLQNVETSVLALEPEQPVSQKSTGNTNLGVWSYSGGHSNAADSLFLGSSFEINHSTNSELQGGSDDSATSIESERLDGAVSGNARDRGAPINGVDSSGPDDRLARNSPDTGITRRPQGSTSLGNKVPTHEGGLSGNPTEDDRNSGSQDDNDGEDDEEDGDEDSDEADNGVDDRVDDEADDDANSDDQDGDEVDDEVENGVDKGADDETDNEADDKPNSNADIGDDDANDDANSDGNTDSDDGENTEPQNNPSRREIGHRDNVAASGSPVAFPRPSRVPPGHTRHVGADSDEGEE